MSLFFKSVAVVVVLILVQYALVHGHVSQCHFCRTYIEGQACNDPFNSTDLQQQHCSNFSLVEPYAKSEVHSATDVSKFAQTSNRTVCIHFSYIDNAGALVSVRGCEYEEYNNISYCSYMGSELVDEPSLNITDFRCRSCTTDLCNSSSNIHLSLAVVILSIFAKVFG